TSWQYDHFDNVYVSSWWKQYRCWAKIACTRSFSLPCDGATGTCDAKNRSNTVIYAVSDPYTVYQELLALASASLICRTYLNSDSVKQDLAQQAANLCAGPAPTVTCPAVEAGP